MPYDILKIYEDIFLSQEEHDDRLLEGIQSEDQNKKTPGVDTENKLNGIYGKKYRLQLNHLILTDHSVFYPRALTHNLKFELKLAPASQVVRGSDPSKLKYNLENIKIEYETIESQALATEVLSTYKKGKGFAYDHVLQQEVITLKKDRDSRINIKISLQRKTLKAVLLLCVQPYTVGTRDTEKYPYIDWKKLKVTVKGSPNKL